MYIGHFAPAFIAAAYPKSPKLPIMLIAAQLVDYGFFTFALFGIENFRITPGISVMNPLDLYDMPYTHSLLGSIFWALGFAILIWGFTKNMVGACIGGAVVLSHWFLDYLVHIPDLTIAGSEPKLGLGLWNHPVIEMPLEFLITFGAVAFYIGKTKMREHGTPHGLYALIATLLLLQAFDWFAPKPESANASLMIMALCSFALVALLGHWTAKNREYD